MCTPTHLPQTATPASTRLAFLPPAPVNRIGLSLQDISISVFDWCFKSSTSLFSCLHNLGLRMTGKCTASFMMLFQFQLPFYADKAHLLPMYSHVNMVVRFDFFPLWFWTDASSYEHLFICLDNPGVRMIAK